MFGMPRGHLHFLVSVPTNDRLPWEIDLTSFTLCDTAAGRLSSDMGCSKGVKCWLQREGEAHQSFRGHALTF